MLKKTQMMLLLVGIDILSFSLFFLFAIVRVESNWEYECAVLCIVHYVYAIIAWKKLRFSFFTPKTLFLLALILFHEGNLLVVAFWGLTPEEESLCMLYRYGEERALAASKYCILFIFVYILLIIFFSGNRNDKIVPLNETTSNLTKIGYILMLAALPTTLFTDYRLSMGRIAQGYEGVYDADVTFYGIPLGYFTKMFYPAIILLLVGYKNKRKQFNRVFVIVLIYYVLRMLLIGRKADSILAIVPIFGLYMYYQKPKLKWYHFAGGYLLVFLSSMVSRLRGEAIGDSFGESIQTALMMSNPIKDILFEMGGTIKAVIQSQMAVPATGSFRLGSTYLWAPVGGILSGLKIETPWITSQTQLPQFLALPERGAYINATVPSMGGSAIGEWYLNFGWVGLLLMPVFIWAVSRYDGCYIRTRGNDLLFVYMNIFLYYFLRYSRQYVIELVWNPLFCIVVIALMNYMFTQRAIRRFDNGAG